MPYLPFTVPTMQTVAGPPEVAGAPYPNVLTCTPSTACQVAPPSFECMKPIRPGTWVESLPCGPEVKNSSPALPGTASIFALPPEKMEISPLNTLVQFTPPSVLRYTPLETS